MLCWSLVFDVDWQYWERRRSAMGGFIRGKTSLTVLSLSAVSCSPHHARSAEGVYAAAIEA
jgi:hypothetical protein